MPTCQVRGCSREQGQAAAAPAVVGPVDTGAVVPTDGERVDRVGGHRRDRRVRRDGPPRCSRRTSSAMTRAARDRSVHGSARCRARLGSRRVQTRHLMTRAKRVGRYLGGSRVCYRSGFACFVGRPNAGKSTLTNALVGSKIVITSDKPQTTRHAVRGIVTRPGRAAHPRRHPRPAPSRAPCSGERLNDVVRATLADVDVVGFCVPADQRIGPGDRFIAAELAGAARAARRDRHQDRRGRPSSGSPSSCSPCRSSATSPTSSRCRPCPATQVDLLADLLVGHLPEGPLLYPDDVTTDNDTRHPHRRADPRGRARRRARRAAALDRGDRRGDPPMRRTSRHHRGLRDDPSRARQPEGHRHRLAAARGSSTSARRPRAGIEELLGARVHLDLHVAVEADWQRDPKKLDRLGF